MHPLPVTQEGRVHKEGENFCKSSTKLWRTLNMLKKSIIELHHCNLLIKCVPGIKKKKPISVMKERFLMPVSVCTLNKWVLRRIFLSWNAPKQSIHWEKREITKNKIKLPKLEPTQGKENTLPYLSVDFCHYSAKKPSTVHASNLQSSTEFCPKCILTKILI